jgi:hypothetical protein
MVFDLGIYYLMVVYREEQDLLAQQAQQGG